jgi:type III pantothenate kinase
MLLRNCRRSSARIAGRRWSLPVSAWSRSFPSPRGGHGTALRFVDALDGDGIFRGGVILPGPNPCCIQAWRTQPHLKMPPGRTMTFPDGGTADAMFSGVMQSICGAVEQMRARLATADSPTRCFLSGGAAPDIAPHLTAPVDVVDNLVLEGVLALATQT